MQKRKADVILVIGHRLERSSEPLRKNQSSASSDICPPSRAARKLRDVGRSVLNPGTIVLNSVTDYLYREAQECRTLQEKDAFTLALALCAAVRRSDPFPLASASYAAFGSTLERYLKRRSHQEWLQHQELLRCIPDYDPEMDHANVEQKSEERGQQARPRNLYEMPQPKKPAQPQPVPGLPRKSAAD